MHTSSRAQVPLIALCTLFLLGSHTSANAEIEIEHTVEEACNGLEGLLTDSNDQPPSDNSLFLTIPSGRQSGDVFNFTFQSLWDPGDPGSGRNFSTLAKLSESDGSTKTHWINYQGCTAGADIDLANFPTSPTDPGDVIPCSAELDGNHPPGSMKWLLQNTDTCNKNENGASVGACAVRWTATLDSSSCSQAKGTLIIEKISEGGTAVFPIVADGTSTNDVPYSLNTSPSGSALESQGVDADTYTITETAPAGWDLVDIQCVSDISAHGTN